MKIIADSLLRRASRGAVSALYSEERAAGSNNIVVNPDDAFETPLS
jgi:hypothetical protein